ncbi:alpha,alpha-trehalase nth1 [Pleosporales sp. CAS-2024a]
MYLMQSQRTRDIVQHKTKLSAPHILVLIVGFTYLVSLFTLFQAGLSVVQNTLIPRFHHVGLQLHEHNLSVFEQGLLQHQMDTLLDSQLVRRPFETYEDCLARGLFTLTVDQTIRELGFLYPEFRDQAMDWTVGECQRLHYSPAILSDSLPQLVLQQLACLSYRARRLVTKAAEAVVISARPLHLWLFNKTGAAFFQPPEAMMPLVRTLPTCSTLSTRMLMPLGFVLVGNTSPCNITYVGIDGVSAGSVKRSRDLSMQTEDRLNRLRDTLLISEKMQVSLRTIVQWFLSLEILGIISYIASIYICRDAKSPSVHAGSPTSKMAHSRITKAQQGAIISIISQLAAMFANVCANRTFIQGKPSLKDIASLMVMLVAAANLVVDISTTKLFTIPRVYGALKQLTVVVRQPNLQESQAAPQHFVTMKGSNDENNAKTKSRPNVPWHEPRSIDSSSQADSQAAPMHSDETSPPTLQKEVRNTTRMANRTGDTRSEEQSDPGSDSDLENYVDVTGGSASTVAGGFGWSVVDS